MPAIATPNTPPAARWASELILPCARYPEGCPGVLSITSFTKRGPVSHGYMVEPIRDGGRIVGWEMENLNNGEAYQIDHPSWGWPGAECTCGSAVFGRRVCKHVLSLMSSLKEIGAI